LSGNFIINETKDKTLDISEALHKKFIKTDYSLLLRIIVNMIINAFEATDKGGNVKLWFEEFDNTIRFCVWNNKAIPEEITMRIFQRHFSTKQEYGRGIGTFTMKFFGENLLGGKVDFDTSEANGTTFRFCLPQ
jgi:signal transduction histidine kinase